MATGKAMEWRRKAYAQLSGMKRRGLFISAQDEQFLEQFRRKAGGIYSILFSPHQLRGSRRD